MTTFPHRYETTIVRTQPARATISAPPRPPIAAGPPPEFRGDASTWSPEHLLCAALGACLFATFEAFAVRDKIAVVAWTSNVTGVLDKTEHGLRFTSFTVAVEITVDRVDVARAQQALDLAKKSCIVSNALAVPVTIDAHIWEHDHRAHA
jgi:organic hydroperoxide reductase OsmC/OhrA